MLRICTRLKLTDRAGKVPQCNCYFLWKIFREMVVSIESYISPIQLLYWQDFKYSSFTKTHLGQIRTMVRTSWSNVHQFSHATAATSLYNHETFWSPPIMYKPIHKAHPRPPGRQTVVQTFKDFDSTATFNYTTSTVDVNILKYINTSASALYHLTFLGFWVF